MGSRPKSNLYKPLRHPDTKRDKRIGNERREKMKSSNNDRPHICWPSHEAKIQRINANPFPKAHALLSLFVVVVVVVPVNTRAPCVVPWKGLHTQKSGADWLLMYLN